MASYLVTAPRRAITLPSGAPAGPGDEIVIDDIDAEKDPAGARDLARAIESGDLTPLDAPADKQKSIDPPKPKRGATQEAK